MYMFQHSSVSLFGLALVKVKAKVQEEGAELLYALQSRRESRLNMIDSLIMSLMFFRGLKRV